METTHQFVLIYIRQKDELGTLKHIKALQYFVMTIPRQCFFFAIYLHVFLCHIALSVSCSLVFACLNRADLLALLYVMFSCNFVSFPYGVVWYLIVSLSDLAFFLFCRLDK